MWSVSCAGVRGAGVRHSSLPGQLLRCGIGPHADHTVRPQQVCIVRAILPSEPRGMFRFAAFRVLEQRSPRDWTPSRGPLLLVRKYLSQGTPPGGRLHREAPFGCHPSRRRGPVETSSADTPLLSFHAPPREACRGGVCFNSSSVLLSLP